MLKVLISYSSALFASNIFTGILSFFATMLAAKLLNKTDFGLYNHYVLIYATVGIFFISGTQQSLIIFINTDREANEPLFIRLMLTFVLIFSVISGVAFWIALRFFSLATCLAIVAIVPNVFTLLAALVYRASLRARGEVLIRMAISLINSLFTVGLLLIWTSKYAPIVADMCSLILPAGIAFFFLHRHTKMSSMFISPFDPGLRLFWKTTAPLWVAGVLFSLNDQIRRIIVDWHLGVEDLAILSFVYAVYTMVQRPVEMIQRSILPVLSIHKNWSGDEKRIMVVNSLIFPFFGLFIFLCYPILLKLGKYHSYEDTLYYLLIMCSALPIISVEFIFAAMCIAIGQEKINRDVMLLAVLINLPISFFMIFYFGLAGAFWAFPIYNISYGIVLGIKLRHIFKEQISFAASLVARCIIVYSICLTWIYVCPNISLASVAIIIFVLGTRCLSMWSIKQCKEIYWAFKT